jgi:hypothetical protein
MKKSDSKSAVRIAAGATQWPEISPDGKYVSYSLSDGTIRFIRPDGSAVSSIRLNGRLSGGPGRHRWWNNDRIVFIDMDEKGVPGVYVQDFVPGSDTTSTRHLLTAVPTNLQTESIGISPDWSRLTVSFNQTYNSLVLAENVPGVSPPRQK